MSKIDKTKLPYRPCVGIMLLNDNGQVFVATRCDNKNSWQMPQGGIDEGETPEGAALRELMEEIGTNNAVVLARTKGTLKYDLPDHMIGKVWKGRYRGQEQVWVVARYQGKDADINLATAEPEFDNWKWIDAATLPSMIVPFKRPVYEAVLSEFGPVIQSLRDQKRD